MAVIHQRVPVDSRFCIRGSFQFCIRPKRSSNSKPNFLNWRYFTLLFCAEWQVLWFAPMREQANLGLQDQETIAQPLERSIPGTRRRQLPERLGFQVPWNGKPGSAALGSPDRVSPEAFLWHPNYPTM